MNSGVTAQHTEIPLSRTWLFRLASVAFITLIVPMLGSLVRGLVGFFILIALAIIAGSAENSIGRVGPAIRHGISNNKLIVFLSVWYAVGVTLNVYFRGQGLADWRLMTAPIVTLIGVCFAFGFAQDEDSFRTFQIWLILAVGIQSLFTINELASATDIAREMWLELQGAWEFGNQGIYALWTMLLPVFLWRALIERGILRLLLLASTISPSIAVFIASFATPIGLLVIAGGVIGGLALFFPLKGTRKRTALIVVLAMLVSGVTIYQLTSDAPLLSSSYDRIENLLNDFEGGGYTGRERDLSRVVLAEVSIRSFEAEPLLGMGGGSIRTSRYVGGHSSFVDSLGAYGLLGGGGALAGLILVILITAGFRFLKKRNWETLLALTAVVLLVISGIINPYWEGAQPVLILIVARPFRWTIKKPSLDQTQSEIITELRYRRGR